MSLELIKKQEGTLIAPINNCSVRYLIYLHEVFGSAKAVEIKSYLEHAGLNVGVFLIDQGFDSMYIPPEALAGDPALSRFNGGIAVVNITSILKIKGVNLPLGVSLMHELGHAKQYIAKPEWFYNHYQAAMNGTKSSQLAIENENVLLNEKPICQQLDKPFRDKYD